MSRPTADSTAAANSWLRSQRDLRAVLDEALDDLDIAEALEHERIPRAEARAAILEDPHVLAALRTHRDWWKPLLESSGSGPSIGLPSKRLAGVRPVVRIVVAFLVVTGYLALATVSEGATPWPVDVFTLVGLVATVGFAVGLAGEDVWRVLASNRWNWWAWRPYALDEVILPRLFQFLDERRAPDYSTTLALDGVHNLYQDEHDAPVIITSAGQRLRRIMERSTSDAVAIAGYRGVGKTTAIRAAAAGMFSDPSSPPPMRVVVSAPSRYEARDFVLHLHATLAKAVIARTGTMLRVVPSAGWRHVVGWALRIGVGVGGLLGLAFLVEGRPWQDFLTMLRSFTADLWPHFTAIVWVGDAEPTDLELTLPSALLVVAAALVAAFAAVLVVVGWAGKALARKVRARAMWEIRELRGEAERQLDRARFLQTYTSGWSGKVGIPLGSSDLGWTRGSQRAQQQLTHPEVVEAFRDLAREAAEVLISRGSVERILIAIDELDKIAEPEKANEFVNDIKGIFGIDGCLFLVAVSEDAISAFERRGIAVRDAFDSAFSEMVRMDSFTLAESRRWMGRRLRGLQEPFGCLCHCLSGGLARDLRRATIDMIDAVSETRAFDLESVTDSLLDRELDRKAQAFAAAVRRLDDSAETAAHLADLQLMAQVRTPAELVDLAVRLAPDETSSIPSSMPRTRWQSACFVLFCATVREVFTNDVSESDLAKGVEPLAAARAQLAVDPRVAWRMVCEVRGRFGAIPVPGRSAQP